MQVWELIEELEDLPDSTEVRLAMQPSWPFEHTAAQVVYNESSNKVFIGEGHQVAYLKEEISDELGWS